WPPFLWDEVWRKKDGENRWAPFFINPMSGQLESVPQWIIDQRKAEEMKGPYPSCCIAPEFASICETILERFESPDHVGPYATTHSWFAVARQYWPGDGESDGCKIFLWKKGDSKTPFELRLPLIDEQVIDRLCQLKFSDDESFLHAYEWPNRV